MGQLHTRHHGSTSLLVCRLIDLVAFFRAFYLETTHLKQLIPSDDSSPATETCVHRAIQPICSL